MMATTDMLTMLEACLMNPEDHTARLALADAYEEAGDRDGANRHRNEANRIKRNEREKGYNGWTNYDTWCVALWLDNDQGSQRYWQDQTEESCGTNTDDGVIDRDGATDELAEMLKSDIGGESAPELDGMYGDLLSAAVSEVDWREIARHYVDEVPEPETEEDHESEITDCAGCGKTVEVDDAFRVNGEWLCVDCAQDREDANDAVDNPSGPDAS